jgi:hypothetical protein
MQDIVRRLYDIRERYHWTPTRLVASRYVGYVYQHPVFLMDYTTLLHIYWRSIPALVKQEHVLPTAYGISLDSSMLDMAA